VSGDRNRLHRDIENGRLAGVCSGIADHFGFDVGMVRLCCILGCIFFSWFVIPAYLLMAFTLPVKPGQEGMQVPRWRHRMQQRRQDAQQAEAEAKAEEDAERKRFEQGVNRAPRETFQAVRHSFRELESRLQRMERYVTSRHYDLDREFRDLET